MHTINETPIPTQELKAAEYFHGHRCPAMPQGLRAGHVAMDWLGVSRARGGGELVIRANLRGGIVLKTSFPGSFMEMSFPVLSGSPPVLDIEKSLHELAEVIPDELGIAPNGAGYRRGRDIHREKKSRPDSGTHRRGEPRGLWLTGRFVPVSDRMPANDRDGGDF